MIKVESQLGTVGFAIEPNISAEEVREIASSMPKKKKRGKGGKSGSRFAVVDLVPTAEMMMAIRILEEGGHKLVAYRDHHADPRRPVEMRNRGKLRMKIKGAAVIETREAAPSATGLVEPWLWRCKHVDVVLFHGDTDGLFGFLRGCGVGYGAGYQKMVADAEILDGAGRGRWLSETGKLVMSAENLIPPYYTNPEGYAREKTRVYQQIADDLARSGELGIDFRVRIYVASNRADEVAVEVAEKAILSPGSKIALADFRQTLRAGAKPSISTWKQAMRERFRNRSMLLCNIGIGHLGEQVYVELPREWRGRFDLRELLPDGVAGRLPNRVQVPLGPKWEAFAANWYALLKAEAPYLLLED
jgi:hypothetical protein